MSFSLPPIAQLAERLLLDIEQAVSNFSRRHRYTAGAELRTDAMAVTILTHRAWRDRDNQAELLHELRWAIDTLKIRLQLCSRLRAFASFGQFDGLARQARELGKQAGGWYRRKTNKHPGGQNVQGGNACAQRAKKLSTRSASQWEVYR